MSASQALPPSLWAATAPPAPPTPPLRESRKVDVLIVGGGFTGLSTALHLAEAGVQVCVLEANEPGWGASGRNGGQVNPTLKHDPDELTRLFRSDRAAPLIDAVSRSADVVFDLIARHGIDCQPVRNGWLQVAYSPKQVAGLHARAEQWARRGVKTEMLDHAAVSARLGTEAFAGGWLDPRAGGIQPLAYTRGPGARRAGRARRCMAAPKSRRWSAGARTGTPAHRPAPPSRPTRCCWPPTATPAAVAGAVAHRAGREQLHRRDNEPLEGAAADAILSRGETASTSQRLLLYFRKDAQGRLLMGGRGHFADPEGPADFAHLERSLELLFPSSARCAMNTAGPAASPSRATSCRTCTRPRRA
jgi:glycine/D-amino acid oxidase-like deaminating enzyme